MIAEAVCPPISAAVCWLAASEESLVGPFFLEAALSTGPRVMIKLLVWDRDALRKVPELFAVNLVSFQVGVIDTP